MENKSDRRHFKRFLTAFTVEVAAVDGEGKEFKDSTVLKNISGEGAKFVTRKTEKYFLGQALALTIHLPGSAEVKARMRGKATVIRLDPISNSEMDEKKQTMGIVVKLIDPLHFERDDVHMQGSSNS